jgi:hypothetical protein
VPTTNAAGSIESALEQVMRPEQAEESVTEEAAPEEEQEQEQEEAPESDEDQDVEDDESEDTDESEPEEESDEDTDEDSDGPTDLYTVKVDGEEVKVSLDDLKRGYAGQQYIQKGMKQAAEATKEAQRHAQTLNEERAKVYELSQALMTGQLRPPPQEPDPNLLNTDPLAYHQQRLQYDEDVKNFQQSAQQFKQLQEQNAKAQEDATRAYAQEQGRMLTAIDPEWADGERARAKFDRLTKGGVEHYGYAEEEVKQVLDHRAILVLQDALAYREMKSKGLPQAEEKLAKAKQARGSAKPRRTSKSRQMQAKRERLKKTGSVEDALDLMFK